MEKWSKVKLGEIAFITSSKRIFAREYQKEGIPFYRGKEIIEKHNGNSVSTELYISKKRYDEIKSKYGVPVPGDILLSSVGTLGVPWLVDEEKFYFKDGNLTWLRCNEKCIPKFLYLWFNSAEAKNQIEVMCIGSTQKALTIDALNKFNVSLPPLEVQKKICNVIYSIMDKIHTNDEINRNLYEQIGTLCEAWLTDYEPFGGVCPEDWIVTPLSDIAEFISGYSYKGKELVEESKVAMATIKNFERKGGFKLDGYKTIEPSDKLKEVQHVELFDTLVAHTDLTQNADVIGNAELVLSKFGYDDIVFSMDLVKVLPKNESISPFLLAALLHSNSFKQHCLGYVNGTTVLHLSKKALPDYKLPLPKDMSQLKTLDRLLEVLYKQIATNIESNIRFEKLRDSLLPMLMSGKLDVSDLNI
ncbi:restriction endonuclease subunit S [Clostridium sp. AF16-25]|nr:restriction endonuclease subunit S [Clostridium sp. AF16-25]